MECHVLMCYKLDRMVMKAIIGRMVMYLLVLVYLSFIVSRFVISVEECIMYFMFSAICACVMFCVFDACNLIEVDFCLLFF